MNHFFNKRNEYCFILAVFVCFQIPVLSQSNFKAQAFYIKNILHPILKQTYRNFEYRKIYDDTSVFKTSSTFTNKVMINDTDIAFINNDIVSCAYLFSGKAFKYIDNETAELMSGINTGDIEFGEDKDGVEYEYSAHWHYNNNYSAHIDDFYQLVDQKNIFDIRYSYIKFSIMSDTIIQNVPFTIISYHDKSSHYYNDSTGKYDIPNYSIVSYYYNNIEKRLQYIYSRPMDFPGNKAWEINKIEINITFNDNRQTIDSIFNFAQEQYKNYSIHNNTDNLPQSWNYHHVTKEELNDTVLDYPIISIADNTITTLRKQEGWTLVYFWTLGCKPCFEKMRDLSNNTLKIGFSYMKEHGINFMMINPIAGNVEKLLSIVDQFKINDILYYSKGLGKIFNTYKYPTLLLISPDKKIFHRLKSLDELPTYIE